MILSGRRTVVSVPDSTRRGCPLEGIANAIAIAEFFIRLWRVDDAFIIQNGQRFSNSNSLEFVRSLHNSGCGVVLRFRRPPPAPVV